MNTENKEITAQQNKTEVAILTPATDIYESQKGVVLYVDLPGVSKNTLDIDVDQNILTIKGEIELAATEEMQPTYMDIRGNVFERRFTLGDELDSSKIEAKIKQGTLKLSIPRLEQHQPKKIAIKVA